MKNVFTGASRDLGRNTALDLADPPHERGDAARNRALLLDAARRLIAVRGPDMVTMDEIAAAAGVGKGTSMGTAWLRTFSGIA